MAGETFREAWELAPALGAILLFQLQQGLAVCGSSREDAGSNRSRQAGHRNQGRKAFYGAERLGRETVFHSKAFSMEIRAAKVPKNVLCSLKHSKASYISA